jgi:two-component system, OmpR family, KDP operon response regulator KdpE
MTGDLEATSQGVVLIVDSDSDGRRAMRDALRGMNFAVVEASRGEAALSLVRTTRFDLVLLETDLPGMGAMETCRCIRSAVGRLPILMLSSLDSEDIRIEALDAGADDYILKPFRIRELAARLRSAVRRRNATDNNRDASIQIGRLELDPVKYRVQKDGRPIHLTPKEFEMLHYLMMHAGEPIPHARLLKSVWGPEYGQELEYLRTFVRQIRRKIEDNPRAPQYLHTHSYIGYRFSQPQS